MIATLRPGDSRRIGAALLIGLTLLAGGPKALRPQQETIVIKLATLAPNGSAWHEIYKDMGARWADLSEGRVDLRVYPGGVAGEESDVLRKMRIGQLHAAGLSLPGLARVTPAVNALAIPMAMETPQELARVREVLQPRLEEVFYDSGYVLLNWGDIGWMRFFVPDPDGSVDAVRRHRFIAWSQDATLDIWREAGFRSTHINLSDVLPGLKTGLVDAVGTTPLVVLSNQWFPFVPYMVDLPWAPLVGATLVDRRVWDRIPEDLQTKLKAAARETGRRLQSEISRLEDQAIAEMVKRGLQIVELTPEERADWLDLFVGTYPKIRGPVIPEAWFDETMRVVGRGGGR
jgi:TRAP-type C4-dicarboxylate transport system substrate-binding protein